MDNVQCYHFNVSMYIISFMSRHCQLTKKVNRVDALECRAKYTNCFTMSSYILYLIFVFIGFVSSENDNFFQKSARELILTKCKAQSSYSTIRFICLVVRCVFHNKRSAQLAESVLEK